MCELESLVLIDCLSLSLVIYSRTGCLVLQLVCRRQIKPSDRVNKTNADGWWEISNSTRVIVGVPIDRVIAITLCF